jgi:hypothetical protein
MSLSVSKPKKQLIVRFLPDVSREVRQRTHILGDLGILVEASVMIFDWFNVSNIPPIKTGRSVGQQVAVATTVLITQECFQILSLAKARHGVSINSLINLSISTWLKENPGTTLKSWLRQQHETAFPGVPYEA